METDERKIKESAIQEAKNTELLLVDKMIKRKATMDESHACSSSSTHGNSQAHEDIRQEWQPRSYPCSFCERTFSSAQALGGHMNVHRRDRARLRQLSPPSPSKNRVSSQILSGFQDKFSSSSEFSFLNKHDTPSTSWPPVSSKIYLEFGSNKWQRLLPSYGSSNSSKEAQYRSLSLNNVKSEKEGVVQSLKRSITISTDNLDKEQDGPESLDLELRLGRKS